MKRRTIPEDCIEIITFLISKRSDSCLRHSAVFTQLSVLQKGYLGFAVGTAGDVRLWRVKAIYGSSLSRATIMPAWAARAPNIQVNSSASGSLQLGEAKVQILASDDTLTDSLGDGLGGVGRLFRREARRFQAPRQFQSIDDNTRHARILPGSEGIIHRRHADARGRRSRARTRPPVCGTATDVTTPA